LLGSGNRLTELNKYGQDMASQEYENQFGRLSSLLGNYGQTQASMFGSLANVLGNGAIGAGGARDAWGAYGAERSSRAFPSGGGGLSSGGGGGGGGGGSRVPGTSLAMMTPNRYGMY
jgi:hypothetical protein